MPLGIAEEIIARQPPEAQAIIRLLRAEIAKREARVKELEGGRKTPQNSSLPPGTVHPHAKPASPKRTAKKKRGGRSGPRLMAFTALLMAYCRQSKRRTAEFPSTLLGQPCCASLTVKIQNRVTAAVRPSYEELAAALAAEEQAKIDETGTRQENGKAWLGTFVARRFTVFAVRATREAPALTAFLGEAFDGIVPCDRATMSWPLGYRLRHAVRALGQLSPRPDLPGGLGASDGTGPPQGGVFAAARRRMGPRRHARHVPGIGCASPAAVDVLAPRRGRADEQRGRTVAATCGDLAKPLLRDAKRQRQSLRRDDAHGGGNLPPAASQRLRLSNARR